MIRIQLGDELTRQFHDALPIRITGIVSRTQGYTYDVKLRALCIVQGPFSVAPCQTLLVRFATFTSL
jgi:hypothetical protein